MENEVKDIIEYETGKLYDIAKRIESFDMSDNVREGVANDIYDTINRLRKHFIKPKHGYKGEV